MSHPKDNQRRLEKPTLQLPILSHELSSPPTPPPPETKKMRSTDHAGYFKSKQAPKLSIKAIGLLGEEPESVSQKELQQQQQQHGRPDSAPHFRVFNLQLCSS
jgi:hypothetical protein